MAGVARMAHDIEARSQPEALAARTAAAPAEAARRSAHPQGQEPLHTVVKGVTAAAADDRRRSAGGHGPRRQMTAARAALPRGRSEGELPHVGAHRSEGDRHGWRRSWLEGKTHQCDNGRRLPLCLRVEDSRHDARLRNRKNTNQRSEPDVRTTTEWTARRMDIGRTTVHQQTQNTAATR